jgi:hypothetical protein
MFTHDRPDGFIVGEDLPDGNLVVADLSALNASHLPQRALRARRSQRIKRVGTGCSCLKFPSRDTKEDQSLTADPGAAVDPR